MSDYVILTDSTSDLTLEMYKDLGVKVIPMEFLVDGNSYKQFSMSSKEFYEKLRSGSNISTSRINIYDYKKYFQEILKDYKNIIYLAFGSGLSGSYHISEMAAKEIMEEDPVCNIKCIDTLCASIGEGLLVYFAAQLRNNGASFEELCDWVQKNKLRVCHWFMVDDLDNLKRGGRLNVVKASIGNALSLKPVISLNEEGKLFTVSKKRGYQNALDDLLKFFESDKDASGGHTVIVGHADNETIANLLIEKLKTNSAIEKIYITEIGPVIGTHVGSGMCALTFLGKRRG